MELANKNRLTLLQKLRATVEVPMLLRSAVEVPMLLLTRLVFLKSVLRMWLQQV